MSEKKILEIVKSAKLFAQKQHRGQKRSDHHTPYTHHLRDVVKNLEMMGINDESILCAGWLHDVIEDTDTDFDEIATKFGKKTAQIVSDVTKEMRLPKTLREKNYLKQLSNCSWQAKSVKLGDILANISDLKNSGFTSERKINQVKGKMKYLNAIKSGIIQNKIKIPQLQKYQTALNLLLDEYGYKPIKFV